MYSYVKRVFYLKREDSQAALINNGMEYERALADLYTQLMNRGEPVPQRARLALSTMAQKSPETSAPSASRLAIVNATPLSVLRVHVNLNEKCVCTLYFNVQST